MLTIGLFGCGRIGQMHADNIAKNANTSLASVFDVHAPAAELAANRLGCSVAGTPDDILADGAIDAILIATSTDTHADLIEASARAGKAILCEKPIDLGIDRVNRCAEAIEGCDVPIQIGFNRRFDPGHRAARKAVDDGEIGELHQVIITSRDPEVPPRAYLEVAGGLMRDMTIHDFDLARFMLADEPVEVFAIADSLIRPDLGRELNEVDTAMIILRTADGKMCHINNHRQAVYGYDQRIELVGSTGMVLSENRHPHGVRRFTADRTEAATPYEFFFIERYREAYVAELDAFVEVVRGGKEPSPNFEDGRRALILAEAAYESVRTGRMVRVD